MNAQGLAVVEVEKHLFADRPGFGELLVRDELGARGEAALRRVDGQFLTGKQFVETVCDSMDCVTLGHLENYFAGGFVVADFINSANVAFVVAERFGDEELD